MSVRICAREGCDIPLDGRRQDARYCSDSCRRAGWVARRTGTAGNGSGDLWLRVGTYIREPLPSDWPERSARFWNGVAAIERIREAKQRLEGRRA